MARDDLMQASSDGGRKDFERLSHYVTAISTKQPLPHVKGMVRKLDDESSSRAYPESTMSTNLTDILVGLVLEKP